MEVQNPVLINPDQAVNQGLRLLKRSEQEAAGGDRGADFEDKDITHLIRDGVLTCPICLDVFSDPKTLPCLHTYCKNCLFRLVECRPKRQRQIRCPECREVIVLRKAGLGDLRSSFFVNSLMEIYNAKSMSIPCSVCLKIGVTSDAVSKCMTCRDGLCLKCTEGHGRSSLTFNHKVVPLEEFATGNHDKDLRENQIFPCKNHNRNLDYYCNTCEEVACRDCLLLDHNNHSNTTIKIAFNEKKGQLDALIADVKSKVSNIELSTQQIEKFRLDTEKKGTEVNKIINETGKNVLRAVERDVVEAKKAAKDGCETRVEMLKKYKEDMLIRLKQERTSLDFCERIMSAGKPVEILDMLKMLRKRLHQLSQEEDKMILEQIQKDTRMEDIIVSERFQCKAPLMIFRKDPKAAEVCDGETQTEAQGACGGQDDGAVGPSNDEVSPDETATMRPSSDVADTNSADHAEQERTTTAVQSEMNNNENTVVETQPQAQAQAEQAEIPAEPSPGAIGNNDQTVLARTGPIACQTGDPLFGPEDPDFPSVSNYVIYQAIGTILSLLMHFIIKTIFPENA